MRLQAVEINNFLSFGSFHWSGVDPQLNLIVGPNGGGKTNFGRALRAAVDAFDHQRRVRWAQAANAASNSPAYRITLDVSFTDD